MSITIKDHNVFHLQTDHCSYLFTALPTGQLAQLYYGAKVNQDNTFQNLATREWHDSTTSVDFDHPDYQKELIKAEYSDFGTGDFREPAFQITNPNGSRITNLNFVNARVVDGKSRLAHLPSTFDENADDAQTLTITLEDKPTSLKVELFYTIFPHQDVIVRSARFTNNGDDAVDINRALSAQLDLPDHDYDLMTFAGSWARERHLVRRHLTPGLQGVESLRTASSHQENPFFMLARPHTDNDQGAVYGFNLVYSGNFTDIVDVDQFGTARVLTGINPQEFGWHLKPGSSFQTPEAIMSFTTNGMNQLSQQMSAFYQHHLVNQRFSRELRPILINNWEATYFDFDQEKLMKIADKAHDVGIEMFVLDDGWFGHRNDDTSSLGDWFVNEKKLPNGLQPVVDHVHGLKMKFGLWFEPEMINKDSQLYQDHPEWMIHVPGRPATPGRNQYVLDMTDPDVRDYLFTKINRIIKDTGLDYIKWDMNRNITEMYSAKLTKQQQLEFSHRYILGVYDLYDRLTNANPQVLFESCASGGGRFDLGMMYYAPQAWTSDDTDAVERIFIQDGTSYGYSPNMMGAHVSAVPNGQVGRLTSIDTRAKVAFFGDFGYELDITKLPADELAAMKKQIAFYKKYRPVFQQGKFYRLIDPFTGDHNVAAWEVVNDDQSLAIASRYQILNHPNPSYLRLYFRGLDPKKTYTVNGGNEHFSGDLLMNAGYFVPRILPAGKEAPADFHADLFVAKAVK